MLTIEIADKEGLQIVIADDGIGLQSDPNRTTGTGQGLALHTTLLAMLGGTLTVESQVNRNVCDYSAWCSVSVSSTRIKPQSADAQVDGNILALVHKVNQPHKAKVNSQTAWQSDRCPNQSSSRQVPAG